MKKIITSLALFAGLGLSAQVKVGDNVTTLAPGSLFEMESTNKGLLLPRIALTNTSAILPVLGTHAQATGMVVYNTATAGDVTPGLYSNDGTKWVKLGGAAAATPLRILTGQTATGFDFSANSNYDIYEFTGTGTLLLPAPASFTGRTIYIRNQSVGTISYGTTSGINAPKGTTTILNTSAMTLFCDGTTWHLISGRP